MYHLNDKQNDDKNNVFKMFENNLFIFFISSIKITKR